MVIAFISAVLISFIVSTLSSITVIPLLTNKIIKDARDDSSLVRLYGTDIIPEIKD
jgi:multidrug efflux pump subunit AcrB